MGLEAYLDSIAKLATSLASPTHRSEGLPEESLGSSISPPSNGLSEAAAASQLDMSSRNLSAYIAQMTRVNANLVSGDASSTVLNNSINSRPSIGASSLAADAHLQLAGAAHLQRCSSTNMDSYRNLPSSPLSFSSNNFSASVIDASSKAKPTPSSRDQNSQLGQKRLCPQVLVGGTQTTSQAHRGLVTVGKRQEPGIIQMCKKPRLDMNQENILHQKIIEQLQRQDPMLLQDHNQPLQALMQHHKLRNQQQRQILQSIPQLLGIPAQQPQQVRHHLQELGNHRIPAVQPHDSGICSRRLMQYIYHLRHRPPDNNIAYWRKFVADYYAPGAQKSWCLSSYDNIGEHALGVFSHSAMEAWQCDICGSKSQKGFVFEILPRLCKIKFESGIIDELLFLDFPHECRLPSGLMILRYGKAVQESVYEQVRVVREGQLRIIFSHNLKILSWVFCARRHEELVARSLVAPQVNQLIQAAKKCQRTSKDGGTDGVSAQDLQLNCNLFVKAGRQLTRNLELLLVNDLGFSKRYVRCLQIAEVVNNMKELMTFSLDNNIGPIESLREYPRKETTTNYQIKQTHEVEWLASAEGLLSGKNQLTDVCPGSSSNMNENSCMTKDEVMTGSKKVEMNCYEKLPRQNYTLSTVKQERSSSVNCSSQSAIPSPILGSQFSSPRVIQSTPVSYLSTSELPQDSENLQQLMIHKLLREMVSNSRAKGVQNATSKVKEEVLEEFNGSVTGQLSTRDWGTGTVGSGPRLGSICVAAVPTVLGNTMGRRDCFKSASNSNSSIYVDSTFVKREADIPERFNLPEAVQDMDSEFFRNGVLDDWNS